MAGAVQSWFTLFGQFFDHGLDLVNKGGSGTVFIPLQPDDPLYVRRQPDQLHGADPRHQPARAGRRPRHRRRHPRAHQHRRRRSSTRTRPTPRIPRTRCSCASTCSTRDRPIRSPPASCIERRPTAAWRPGPTSRRRRATARHPADRLDVANVPLLAPTRTATSSPAPNGFPQLVIGSAPTASLARRRRASEPGGHRPITVTRAAPSAPATPSSTTSPTTPCRSARSADGDIDDRPRQPRRRTPAATYDNELLDAHFIAGDGRGNENIGLTAVHHVFHAEHNRLVEHIKDVDPGDRRRSAFLNEWLRRAGAGQPSDGIQRRSTGTASACSRRPSSAPRCSISTSCSRSSPARSSRTSTCSCAGRLRRHHRSVDRRRVRARGLPLRPLDADRDHRPLRRRRQRRRADRRRSRSA